MTPPDDGVRVRYASTRALTAAEFAAVTAAAARYSGGFGWLLCEPPRFATADGRAEGSSAPRFHPAAEDLAAAAAVCGPHGTVETLLEVLSQVSRECGVDWELTHDAAAGRIGFVTAGVPDPAAVALIDGVADLADASAAADGVDGQG